MRRVRMHALNDDFAIVFAPAALLTSAPAGLLTHGRLLTSLEYKEIYITHTSDY